MMRSMHHLVRHHMHNAKYLDRTRMYWTMSLKTFAVSLVGVFVPAYLYQLGFSVQEIILYFLVRELIELVMVYPTSLSMMKFGVKSTFAAGCVLSLVNLILLYFLPGSPELYLAAAAIEGLAISMFFLPYHYMFSAAVTRRGGGSQVGFMDILLNIVMALGPLIGGLIASATNLQVVLLMAAAFVGMALGPLIKGRHNEYLIRFSYAQPLRMLITRDSASNMGFGVTEMAATILWPLFIFLLVQSYATLGIVISGSLLLIILLDSYVGRLTDKGLHSWLMNLGAVSSAILHIGRFAASSTGLVVLVNVLSDVTHTLFRIPWTKEFYQHAGRQDRATYIAAMELAVCIGRAVFWSVLLLGSLLISLEGTLIFGFILGAIGSLFVPLIVTKNKKKLSFR